MPQQVCHHCQLAQEAPLGGDCRYCGHRLFRRRPFSVQRTLALLSAAACLLLVANLTPMMLTYALGSQRFDTIYSGALLLWHEGHLLVAVVVFVASMVIPIVKIVGLAALCLAVCYCRQISAVWCYRAFVFVSWIGRWSMIDLFVIAIVLAVLDRGYLVDVDAGPAALSFAACVVLTMLAAQQFDTRLLWDKHNNDNGGP